MVGVSCFRVRQTVPSTPNQVHVELNRLFEILTFTGVLLAALQGLAKRLGVVAFRLHDREQVFLVFFGIVDLTLQGLVISNERLHVFRRGSKSTGVVRREIGVFLKRQY